MGYSFWRGLGYFISIIIIIVGFLFFPIGLVGVILGFIFIWMLRRSAKQEDIIKHLRNLDERDKADRKREEKRLKEEEKRLKELDKKMTQLLIDFYQSQWFLIIVITMAIWIFVTSETMYLSKRSSTKIKCNLD